MFFYPLLKPLNSFQMFAPTRTSESSPSDPLYLKICFVCSERAPEGKDHYSNYGGIVCLSCRAFFRRANQQGKSSEFTCKQQDSCIIQVSNRRCCQRCRYTRCLRAGMDPEAVLTDHQRQIRFRKHLLKKKNQIVRSSSWPSDAHQLDGIPAKGIRAFVAVASFL